MWHTPNRMCSPSAPLWRSQPSQPTISTLVGMGVPSKYFLAALVGHGRGRHVEACESADAAGHEVSSIATSSEPRRPTAKPSAAGAMPNEITSANESSRHRATTICAASERPYRRQNRGTARSETAPWRARESAFASRHVLHQRKNRARPAEAVAQREYIGCGKRANQRERARSISYFHFAACVSHRRQALRAARARLLALGGGAGASAVMVR